MSQDEDIHWDLDPTIKERVIRDGWKPAKPRAYTNGHDAPPEYVEPIHLPIRTLTIPPIADIRPRPWLYGYWAMRGAVTLIAAPGGTGKTALITTIILACATGRPLLNETPIRAMNICFLGLEESTEEMHRRFAAAMIHFGINQDEFDGRVFFLDGGQYGFSAAALDGNGMVEIGADMAALQRDLQDLSIDLLCCDPLALLHSAPENDNAAMAQVIRYFKNIAHDCDCGVVLIHHTRKGAIAGDPDGIRGAGALVNHARIAIGLTPMSDDESKDFNIPKEEKAALVRIDDLKRNYSPRSGLATWIKLESISLGNITETYPLGDYVQVPTVWTPPQPTSLSTDASNEILDEIARGHGIDRYSQQKKSKNWAGDLISAVMNRRGIPSSDNFARDRIKDWIKNNVLYEQSYRHSETRRETMGLHVNETNRPGYEHND